MVTEVIFPKFEFWKKLPLYFVLSVIISSYSTYLASIVFGFTRWTVLGCFLLFLIMTVALILRRKMVFTGMIRNCLPEILVGILIYSAYFIALLPAIFNFYNGYFVMGGPNWQDTAMHLSIIQSLANGNFPPQAPYFSGQPLSYYYFSDFHAAIVNLSFGKFFPEVLVLLNPFLAATFFFSVFALSYTLTTKKALSIFAGVSAVFFGNFGFLSLVSDILAKKGDYISLVTANPYNFDKFYLQMTPMADYFLQNRPMMVGLPVFMMMIFLLLDSSNKKRKNLSNVLMAGILTGSLLKFQLFGFVVSGIFFGIYKTFGLVKKRLIFSDFLKEAFIFIAPSLFFYLIFGLGRVGGRTLLQVFLGSFYWGAWQTHGPVWFLYFVIENLGVAFVISTFCIFTKNFWKNTEALSIYVSGLVLLVIPLIMRFTIYEFDMLKFLYYLAPIICVLLAYFYKNSKNQKLSIATFFIVMVITSLSSVNILIHSYLSRTQGYSYSDYEAGVWIVDNTPQNSVFVTMPTVHSAPTDIAGRLRIISYINWPYSHGFNVGDDNVFTRVADVENVYKTGDIAQVKIKYHASYLYFSPDEKGKYPEADILFSKNKYLRMVYDKDGIKIYEIL